MSPNETLFLESTTRVTKEGIVEKKCCLKKFLPGKFSISVEISSSSFIQFQVWEYPGQMNAFDPSFDPYAVFAGCGAVILVIDAQVKLTRSKMFFVDVFLHSVNFLQDDYSQALQKLLETVTKAYRINNRIKFEVFIHKVDGLSEEHKIEAQRDIYHRANDDLVDANMENVHLR